MKETFKYKLIRKILFCTGVIMLSEIIFPSVAFALTSGPSQPEFSSFEPVATTNMVNEFTGDMTYTIPVLNLPGANGGGYALSLSYHSGTSSEEEASWVGYGWTLNPGAINRGKKGFADDIKGKTVNYWNKVPANWTATLGGAFSLEAFSADLKKILGGSVNASLRYNNYKGFGTSTGVNLNIAKGLVSLGYNISDGDGSFSAAVNPMALLSLRDKDKNKNDKKKEKYKEKKDEKKNSRFNAMALTRGIGALNGIGSNYGLYSHTGGERALSVNKYKGFAANVNFTYNITPTPLEIGVTYSISGSYNRQENVNSAGVAGAADPVPVFGYMYSADAGNNSQMDYYTEKGDPYDKRDYYLGLPFSNADNFMMTGEGMSGGFRLYNTSTGHFRPRQIASHIQSYNIGVGIETGFNWGGGADLGAGFQRFASVGWSTPSDFARYESKEEWPAATALTDEPYFFRFNNDKGGYLDFGSDDLQRASLKYEGGRQGSMNYAASTSGITTIANEGNRSKRSSYVAYHTNTEMGDVFRAYCQSQDVHQFVNRSNAAISDEVGEYAVTNEDGVRYVYGLPVYSRNEINMQYDVTAASSIQDNYLVYKNISNDADLKVKTGEESATPYASTYLLTEITSPDYIDRSMNGPSDDDFGGYTRFSYSRMYGHHEKDNATAWYRWRTPYTGLLYSRGDLSSSRDDMGGVTAGEKEIYYLDTIITKTHFAVFLTSVRNDGYDAAANTEAANSATAKGSHALKKLDAIKVYSKNEGGSPRLLQTVRFDYYDNANSAFQGIPNCASPGSDGKLTLKRVWFEYEGAVNAKISPYEFEYKYPTTDYPSPYGNIDDPGDGLTETPAYTTHCLDAWGNYQEGGNTRYANMKTWVNQDPAGTFDPAAWQLKVIRLPSGGEIHIQYEQDDYLYVQDRHAEALVSLSSVSDEADPANRKYYLDVAGTFGAGTVSADRAYIKNLIQKNYIDADKKMYFKFLYKLIAGSPGPNLNSCASEYISGYCNVKEVGSDGTGFYVKLGKTSGNKRFDLPVKVCRDYVKKERLGTLNTSGNCSEPGASVSDDPNSPAHVVESLLAYMATKIVPGDLELCTDLNSSLSYFRVPVPPRGKKGGGIRVKRLLMYDAGIESGDAALFGSEYSYRQINGYSSGVATNEPAAIREENALVEFDPRLKQKFLDKVISGRDRDETEKPLGESVLPSASVGYSRVVISNIHTGKTNTGFAVKEFYTAADFPVRVEYTDISKAKDYLPIPGGLINYFVNNLWLTQGFRCMLNEMHGQPRREATYSGDPANIDKAGLSTETAYDYFAPGAPVPVSASPGQIAYTNFGKETEQVMESRGMEDVSNDMAIAFDVSLGIAGILIIPQFSIVPSYTYSESKVFTHVTNKIIQYPVIPKSVRTYAEGIYHLTENLTFDPNTGKPNTTRTYDGYNALNLQQSPAHKGMYTTYNVSAASQYAGMGQKANNERFLYKSNEATWKIEKKSAGPYYFLHVTPAAGRNPCDLTLKFTVGDFIKLTRKSDVNTSSGLFHVVGLSEGGTDLIIERTANFRTANDDLYMDEEVIVEILKSGYTNQLNTGAGGFTTYGDELATTNVLGRNAFAALLDYSAHHGGEKIYADDTFFQTYKDLKANVNNGSCKSFVKADGSFDPSGISSIFKNATGYVQLQVTTMGGIRYTLKINDGTSDVLNCVYNPESSCGDEYKVVIYQPTGQLQIWEAGSTCYFGSCSVFIDTDCFKLCPAANTKISNVIAANAQSFSMYWSYDTTLYKPVVDANTIESGRGGKWRSQSSYVYRDTIIAANTGTERNYNNAGVFDLDLFNYRSPFQYDVPGSKWVKTNTVTSYSPDGNALEERDILGIYSAAKYGYSKTQPYLVAKNADYASVQFESFEKMYAIYGTNELEDAWAPPGITDKRTAVTAHAGQYSWRMTASDSLLLKPVTVTQQMLDKGLSLKVWVNDTAISEGVALKGRLKTTGAVVNYDFTKIANAGQWALYELKAADLSAFSLGAILTPVIVNNYTGRTIWVDDVRFQPLDALVMTYVYDVHTLRLLTSFDDQHFGMFYQYNGEGKLLRKQIETERGVKTITETNYHSAQKTR